MIKICLQCRRPRFNSWVGKIPWSRKWQPTRNGSYLLNAPLKNKYWHYWAHHKIKITLDHLWLRIKNYTYLKKVKYLPGFHGSTEKAMAPHSSTLAWKIPWMKEPGRLQSMGSLRVGYDWATSLWLFTFMHWRRKWQPSPVFFHGESQGRGSLVGCRLWGHTESDTTEVT